LESSGKSEKIRIEKGAGMRYTAVRCLSEEMKGGAAMGEAKQ
jgi:hypothetical protein